MSEGPLTTRVFASGPRGPGLGLRGRTPDAGLSSPPTDGGWGGKSTRQEEGLFTPVPQQLSEEERKGLQGGPALPLPVQPLPLW